MHCHEYYPLKVSIFKTEENSKLFDLLWKKYWIQTLATHPLIADKEHFGKQIQDLAEKVKDAESSVSQSSRLFMENPGERTQLSKVCKDRYAFLGNLIFSARLHSECAHSLISQILKTVLFSTKDTNSI